MKPFRIIKDSRLPQNKNPINLENMTQVRIWTLAPFCISLLLVACSEAPVNNNVAVHPAAPENGPVQPAVGSQAPALIMPTAEDVDVKAAGKDKTPSGANLNPVLTLNPPPPPGNFVTPPNLLGSWRSEQPEPAGNGRYSVRELVFMGNRWTSTYTLASDREMKKILFVLKAKGLVNLQNPSKRLEATYLVAFRNLEKYLTLWPMDKVTQKELGFETCALNPGTEENISSRGCGIATRVTECPVDYDLIRQEQKDSKMYLSLGNRYAEMNSCSEDKRPVALGLPLLRQEGAFNTNPVISQ